MDEKKNNKKTDIKKSFYGVLLITILILSSSYILQSCEIDSPLGPPNYDNPSSIIDDFIKGPDSIEDQDEPTDNDTSDNDSNDDSTSEIIEYFSFDVKNYIRENYENNNLYWYSETFDLSLAPESFKIHTYEEPRHTGWVELNGFLDTMKNGFCFYLIKDNCLELKGESPTFEAVLDFNQCWIDNGRTYTTMEVDGKKIEYYTLISE